ncbi:MAG: DUF3343 domain-containing protein [Clostridia bacterium]|jgi:hypothetical protein|nr:DUF3343 domain-containing protein [Clostridia bacterium]MDD4572166.1 DUF3343 domain-containing protein [Clostridia bacterium]
MNLVSTKLYTLFTFDASEPVISAEAVLKANEIPCVVMPLPTEIAASCGLSLKIWQKDYKIAINLLKAKNLAPTGRYWADKQGKTTHFQPID